MSLFVLVLLGLQGGAAPGAPSLPPQKAPAPVEKTLDIPPMPSLGAERYVGVAPGTPAPNPLPRAKRQPPHLIWSGFQPTEQGSRVFFQTTQQVTFDVKADDSARAGRSATMSVFLRNCRIHLKNNRRRLDTRYFATPVRGVTAVQRRKDVELRIVLKEPATATPRTEPGPDGTHFVVLEFPPGRPDTEPTPRPPRPVSTDESGAPDSVPAPSK